MPHGKYHHDDGNVQKVIVLKEDEDGTFSPRDIVDAETGTVQHVIVDNAADFPGGGSGGTGVDPVSIKDGTDATRKLAVDASGRIGVSNFPATQPVSGSVSVSNLPATQPVSGTVTVSNPTANPETGLAKDATLTARLPSALDADGGIKTHVQNFPASQPVSGTVTVANPTANPETGLAKDATLTTRLPASLDADGGLKVHVQNPSGGSGGGLTNTELRASPVPVSGTVSVGNSSLAVTGPLTNSELRAAAVPVSGPLTDAQLRAAGVPVTGTFWQATQPVSGTVSVGNFPATQPVSGTITVGNSSLSVTGPLTDAQLRATPVPITGTVALGSGTAALFKGRACTFRTPGRAVTTGQNLMALWNAVGSGRIVTIKLVAVDVYQTAAKTVAPPIIRVGRITAAPTGGTALGKVALDTGLSSVAGITITGDASADGTVAATPLATTAQTQTTWLTQEPAPRVLTLTGYEAFDRAEFFGDANIVVREGQGIVLRLEYTVATSNPITDMWTAVMSWEE